MKRIFLTILATMILILLFPTGCAAEKPLRLHVIANSDSKEDQEVKLMVRDRVLEATGEEMRAVQNKDQAKAYIAQHLELIEQEANAVLQEEGFSYQAKATLGISDFPDKSYGGVVYPAGKYEALKITLGNGQGQNWWCVVFPPLCLTQADPEEPVEYKSAILEWFEGLFQTAQ